MQQRIIWNQATDRSFTGESVAAQIRTRIQSHTGGRLRNLRIHVLGERARIAGMAASYHVRQLAEQAALLVLPADFLEFAIDVESAERAADQERDDSAIPAVTGSAAAAESLRR